MDNKQLLYKSFLELRTLDEVEAYLADLLTPAEIREFAERLTIANLLLKGEKYQQISSDTKSSTRTIARVRKCLNNEQVGYNLVLRRLHHHEPTRL